MKITYLFPVFKEDNSKIFFEKFFKTKFFCENKDAQTIIVVNKNDKNNLKFLTNVSIRDPNFKIIVLDNVFCYNDAFKIALKDVAGDVLLLGDLKISKLDLLFEKLLEKHSKNINIVHVSKKRQGVREFFFNLKKSFYNFFIKIFSNYEDKLNITSLGLYDKNVVDILKELPQKCCFLKNVKAMYGFETRTIYIDEKIETYKPNFKKMTSSLTTSLISASLFVCFVLLLIFLNIFINQLNPVYNIIGVFVALLFLIIFNIMLPKHFFDIRNLESTNIFKIEKINF